MYIAWYFFQGGKSVKNVYASLANGTLVVFSKKSSSERRCSHNDVTLGLKEDDEIVAKESDKWSNIQVYDLFVFIQFWIKESVIGETVFLFVCLFVFCCCLFVVVFFWLRLRYKIPFRWWGYACKGFLMIIGPQTMGETLEDCQGDGLLRSKNNMPVTIDFAF